MYILNEQGEHMAKRLRLNAVEIMWLKDNHLNFTHVELADRYGVCVDTVRRLLMRMGLQYFPGAKYQHRQRPAKWTRPCSVCGSKRPRPLNQYRCTSCHEREEAIDRMVDDEEQGAKVSLFKLPPFLADLRKGVSYA